MKEDLEWIVAGVIFYDSQLFLFSVALFIDYFPLPLACVQASYPIFDCISEDFRKGH